MVGTSFSAENGAEVENERRVSGGAGDAPSSQRGKMYFLETELA